MPCQYASSIVGEFSRIITRQRKSGAAKFFLIKIFDSACEIVFSGWTRSVRMDLPRPGLSFGLVFEIFPFKVGQCQKVVIF